MTVESVAAPSDPAPSNTDLNELRLALVCYGGVSLAVYMHGVTKEMYKLVRAARAFESAYDRDPSLDAAANPFRASDVAATEAVYFDALVALAQAGRPTTVVIDVVTGTSAGGINGVCLCHALAHGRPLETFRDLWVEEGSIDRLLEARHRLHLGQRAGRIAEFAQAIEHTLASPGHSGAPLDGGHMSQLLTEALTAMGDGDGTLVRGDESLDLMVTLTDVLGFDSPILDGAGHLAHTDASFRQLMHFRYAGADRDDFTAADVPALAFAARATSSFPGAFPSVSVTSFLEELGAALPRALADPQRIVGLLTYGDDAARGLAGRWYVDGGVLDNGPFDHAIDAIATKRASVQTSRELVYIEPDPRPPHPGTGANPPSWLRVVNQSKLTIPGRQVFVEALTRLAEMNLNITTVSVIAENLQDQVWQLGALGPQGLRTTYASMRESAPEVRARAERAAGLGYGTYFRLRAARLGLEIGTAVCDAHGYAPDSGRAGFVRACVSAWVSSREAFGDEQSQHLEELLGPVDHTYRRRRVQFMLQGVNELLGRGTQTSELRRCLLELKAGCWDLLETLSRVPARTLSVPSLHDAIEFLSPRRLSVEAAMGDPTEFAVDHATLGAAFFEAYRAATNSLTGSSEALWSQFQEIAGKRADDLLQPLASRYLLWPIWDALVFPIIELAGLPELSGIEVRRFSPVDAELLSAVGASGPVAKLQGASLGHFGGFFEQSRRENDYLWGRLDGVELLTTMLLDQAKSGLSEAGQVGDLAGSLRTLTVEGFGIVLSGEAPALTQIAATIDGLQDQVRRLR